MCGVRIGHVRFLMLHLSEPPELSAEETTELHTLLKEKSVHLKTIAAGSDFDDMQPLKAIVGEENFYTVILLLVIGWIIILMLDTLTRVSDVENKARIMIQENGLLQRRIELLEERSAALGTKQDHQVSAKKANAETQTP